MLAKKRALRAQMPEPEPVRLTGTVRDEAGSGIAEALVLLTPKSFEQGMGKAGERAQPVYVRTDAGGGFSLTDVPPGRYTVSATARGYLGGALTAVRVVAGAEPDPLALVLSRGGQVVSGTVEDVSGGPVDGALVSVTRLDAANLISFDRAPSGVLTDEDGAFAMTLPRGTYLAAVTHPDYVANQASFEVVDGPRSVDIALTPGGVIEGAVRMRGSEDAVAGAVVVASAPQAGAQGGGFSVRGFGEHRVVADDEGRFRLSGLPSGVLSVTAVAAGHASAEVTEVSLGIAETTSDVVVWVEPAFTISGFVVPEGGDEEDGLEGVWVGALSLQPPGLTVARRPSEADGFFEIPGVQPGNYMVAALGEDRLPNLTGTSAQVEDEDVTDVLVTMRAGVTISGRIDPPGPATVALSIDAEGMGITGMLSGIANAFVRTRTDEDGRFELHPVAPGSVKVVADADDGSHGELALDVGDEGAQDVVVDLEARVALSGVVVTAAGDPVEDARVNVRRVDVDASPMQISFSVKDNPMFGGGAATREDGTFVARGLEPGEYEVRVRAGAGPSLNFDDEEAPGEPRSFTVPEGGLADVRLVVEGRSGTISGVVVDGDGAPVADAWVRAALEGGGERWIQEMVQARTGRRGKEVEARMQDAPSKGPRPGAAAMDAMAGGTPVLTDAAGRFTIENLREGTYRVTAEANGGTSRVSASSVALGSDLKLEVEALASVRGQVKSGTQAVARYTIAVQGTTPRSKQVNNPQGAYEVAGLDPGTYTVKVSSAEGVAEAEVELERGTTADLDLTLDAYGTLTGTVVDANGEPLAGLVVMTVGDGGTSSVSAGLEMMLGGGPRTDRRGRFSVDDVPPGDGTITVFDPDGGEGGSARADYEVEPGGEADLGTITAIGAGAVPFAERGDLGLRTAVRSWTERPLPPEEDEVTDEEPPADPDRDRLWIRAVSEEGAASKAGLRPGDEILSVRDQDVFSQGVRVAASSLGPSHVKIGTTVSIRFRRGDSEQRVTLTARPRNLAALAGG
ncbi:MAG: carboxypeptidase regulatory-like domain-containing protein [Myxococcota bacterium]